MFEGRERVLSLSFILPSSVLEERRALILVKVMEEVLYSARESPNPKIITKTFLFK